MKKHWSLFWAARWIARWEGWSPVAYWDRIASPPVLTQGYGATGRGVRLGTHWTRTKGLRRLASDCREVARAVDRLVEVPITVRQRMMLISFGFNLGIGALEESTLLKWLNKGRYRKAGNEFLKWNHAGGVEVWGLTRRRRAERKSFLSKMPRRRRL